MFRILILDMCARVAISKLLTEKRKLGDDWPYNAYTEAEWGEWSAWECERREDNTRVHYANAFDIQYQIGNHYPVTTHYRVIVTK